MINNNKKRVAPGSSKADEIELLSMLTEKFERENYPVEPPDPIEAIKFRMDQMNLKQKDITLLSGSKTRIS
jgi:HTH-type transcriptional regulator/antitoxin HigA